VLSFSRNNQVVRWHENTAGDGTTWTPDTIASSHADLSFVEAADIDGDGDDDVVSAQFSTAGLTWHENTMGDGSAWTERTVATGTAGARMVGIADVDGDGDLDVVAGWEATSVEKATWHENTVGDGTAWTEHPVISEAVQNLGVADFDGDGDPDILVSGISDGVRWLENTNGDGSSWARDSIEGLFFFSTQKQLPAADLDRDGDLDVLFIQGTGVRWFPNRGGQFALPSADVAQRYLSPASGSQEILRIDAVHRGRAGDSAVDLESLEFRFVDSLGDPMRISDFTFLFSSAVEHTGVFLDDGSGVFELGSDTPVVPSAAFMDGITGVLTFLFQTDAATEQFGVTADRTYFLALRLHVDAGAGGDSGFQVTHLTESSSTAKDATHDLPLELEYDANVSTAVISRELSTASCSSPAELELIGETVDDNLVCTAGSVLRAEQSSVTSTGDLTLQAGEAVRLGSDFAVLAGGTLTVDVP
jgi:hypothetical protein